MQPQNESYKKGQWFILLNWLLETKILMLEIKAP